MEKVQLRSYYVLIVSCILSAIGYVLLAVAVSTTYYVTAQIRSETGCEDSHAGFWSECIKSCDQTDYVCYEKELQAKLNGMIIAMLVLAAVGFVSIPLAVCDCDEPIVLPCGVLCQKRGHARMGVLTVLATAANVITGVLGFIVVFDFKNISEDRLNDRPGSNVDMSTGRSFDLHIAGSVIILIVFLSYLVMFIIVSISRHCSQKCCPQSQS